MARKRKTETPKTRASKTPKEKEPNETSPEAAPPGETPAPPAAKPGPKDEVEYTELILVAHAGNLAEAELFKSELEAHGIPVILEGESAGVAGIPDVGAGVPVLVPEEFADRAAELIAELEAAKPEGTTVAKTDPDLFEEEADIAEVAELDDEELEEEEDDAEEDEEWEDDEEDDDLEDDEDFEDDEEWEDEDDDEEEWGDDDV